jgi:hypothetical protein
VNPNVTGAAQRQLAAKLHGEIALEQELDHAFRTRPSPTSPKEKKEDNARIFNEFCVAFIDQSKGTKEHVTEVMNQAGDRLKELNETHDHLEEVERRTYQFEMRLPDAPQSAEMDVDKAISDATEVQKSKQAKPS